ncbi:DUF1624 domain-containing protein [Jannaschia sp. W003]|uniref:DUF1624 domain-containing protein n=1 Tax=Jannaschia sp. W003 TaxID=2867012 RepID=UPI0021A3FEE7|nr:heparan-alpha-glucosaminide N-acetyltransferase [Jannaschia sp. W003]UWQ22781.1 DUF1624 domain-containing protein [Jannaschia sp. W003]
MRAEAPGRLPLLDLARAFALVQMALFHLGRDLDTMLPPALRVAEWGFSFGPLWQGWAASIAGSFVFLAGVSLWLAHGAAFRPASFLRRLGVLVLAAAAVSLATWATFPSQWVRFGILHSIALSSVVGLLFLRLPGPVTVLAGLAAVWAGRTLDLAAFADPWWLWTGLSAQIPPMMDYEPLLPWTGPFLIGLGAARIADRAGWIDRLRGWPEGPVWRRLGWPGRHSLAVYLVHQPVIVGAILAGAWVAARL